MKRFPVFSVSGRVLDMLRTGPDAWRVLNIHPRACNLHTENGDIIALVATPYNGPFHVRVPHAVIGSLAGVRRVSYAGGSLRWARGGMDLSAAPIWEPRVDWPDAPPTTHAVDSLTSTALAHCQASIFHPDYPPTAAAEQRMMAQAREGSHLVHAGMRQGSWKLIAAGVDKLAGLGPGLTPAGDDFLVGVMAGLQLWRASAPWIDACCQRIGERAAARTMRLSGAWLRCAARGEFGELWHTLVAALRQSNDGAVAIAVQRMRRIGATSGADALMGLLCATRVCCPLRNLH